MRDYHPDDYERRENPVHDTPQNDNIYAPGGVRELQEALDAEREESMRSF